MNCCDYDCTQGRDCPARRLSMCRRLPDEAPPPRSTWRGWLTDAALAVLLVILVLAVIGLALNS